jgi:hypothetical protein
VALVPVEAVSLRLVEPAMSQVSGNQTGGAPHLEIDAFGFPPTPVRELVLDWISVDLQPYG